MSSENINMSDPLFLVSRSLDADLSKAEQAELDSLLARSPELQADAKRLRAVTKLVKDRSEYKVQIDWDSQRKLVLAEIGEAEPSQSGLDAALHRWAARGPQYDSSTLIAGVLTQIVPAHERKANAWRIVARIGMPLAAAAAIALALTATWYSPVQPFSVVTVIPRVVVEIGPKVLADTESPVSVVLFAKPVERTAAADVEETLTLGYMTLGSAPLVQVEESPL